MLIIHCARQTYLFSKPGSNLFRMDDVHVRNKTNVVKLAAAERVNQGPLVLTLSAPLGLSTSIFSLQYQYKAVLREYKN